MPKKITLVLLASLLLMIMQSFAAKVDQQSAVKVARNFYYERASQHSPVSYTSLKAKETIPVEQNTQVLYYIVNFENNGWVIVSAEDVVQPVIAYSFHGSFSLANKPVQLGAWLTGYQMQIETARTQKAPASQEIHAAWARLKADDPSQLMISNTDEVLPLLSTQWDQMKWYNELCPPNNAGVDNHVPTGCVATSMAQVMNYWRYPTTGNGTKTYLHPNYGVQTANFGTTTYHYSGMCNTLSINNFDVAQLMYHCGVSVNMNYGINGSGTQTSYVPNSVIAYFKYNSTTKYVHKSAYTGVNQWDDLIKAQLDQKRPCIYDGQPAAPSTDAGHAFVCDGYQGTYFFHFNWGWSGMDDGYFYTNNLNPAGMGNFNDFQGAVIDMFPPIASYPNNCTGTQTITASMGTIEDGSGPIANYQPNNNCGYLINPVDSVESITFTFDKFNTDTNDYVTIYNGGTTSAPVLGTFSGSTLPQDLTLQPGPKC
jgi:hypothetical protein